jgi:oligopeptide transport system ATP-binding protein
MDSLLEVKGLTKHFRVRSGTVRAVDGIDLRVERGKTHALVGESGCGKTTIARAIMRLIEPTSGQVQFDGLDVRALGRRQLRRLRRRLQVVFQDPVGSLNPRLTLGAIVGEPLEIHERLATSERRRRVVSLLEDVGLNRAHVSRYPHQLSGGQRQRVGIARALAVSPEMIICDEPVSALDVSVRAQILDLLVKIQRDRGLAFLFISHDLSVVDQIADTVSVMYLGRTFESGSRDQVFRAPAHPYTIALLSAVPSPDRAAEKRRTRIVLAGDPPSEAPTGCVFRTRCWKAQSICADQAPLLTASARGQQVACHFPEHQFLPARRT